MFRDRFSAERISAKRVEDHSRTWERAFADGATLHDIDIDLVRTVASQIAYGISPEKCLQYLDLAEFTPDGLRLRKAAILLFAKDVRRWHAGCKVRIMIIRGQHKGTGPDLNIEKDSPVEGNILTLIDQAWERLTTALTEHIRLSDGARFHQTYSYPQSACREALINAIVHRNYAIEGRGIEICLYTDRMELTSPGMLLSTIALEDIQGATGAHESRNPLVARVLREVGFVREMGEGVRRIFQVMRSNALVDPAFTNASTGFTVTLFNKSIYPTEVKLWLSNFDYLNLSEAQRAILALGYGGREFSTQDVIDRLGIVDRGQLAELFHPLRSAGVLVRTLTHGAAIAKARELKISKREVPQFRVILPSEVADQLGTIDDVDDDIDAAGMREFFVARLPYDMTRERLVDVLQAFGDLVEIDMPAGTQHGSANRGFAFVTIKSLEPMQSLMDRIVAGTSLNLKPRVRRSPLDRPGVISSGTLHKIYVGNIPRDLSRKTLLSKLSATCMVTQVRMPINRELGVGYNRGYAFVTVADDAPIETVLSKLDGLVIAGRIIRAQRLRPREGPQQQTT